MRVGWVGSDGGNNAAADCGNNLDSGNGRVLGVDRSAEGGVAQEIVRPTLEETVAVINNPDLNRKGMIKQVTKMYQQ